MSLRGSLRDFGLPEVFQLIAQQGKTGVLEVKGDGGGFEIAFREGRVARARPTESRPDDSLADLLLRTGVLQEPDLRAARGRQQSTLEPLTRILEADAKVSRENIEKTVRILTHETIFELFRCAEGNFRFRPETVEECIGDEAIGADHVLLDAMRMQDEWPLLQARLPDLSLVPVPTVDLETFQGRRGAVDGRHGIPEALLEQVFRLTDGRHPARRVIDLTRLGTFEGARVLVALERAELIRFEAPSKESQPRSRPRGHVPGLGALLPGVVALAVAAVLAGSLWLRLPATEASLPIATDTLSASRSTTLRSRIQAALEVRRWANGGYPPSLLELKEGVPRPLAPPEEGRYSYSRIPGGYRLYRVYP